MTQDEYDTLRAKAYAEHLASMSIPTSTYKGSKSALSGNDKVTSPDNVTIAKMLHERAVLAHNEDKKPLITLASIPRDNPKPDKVKTEKPYKPSVETHKDKRERIETPYIETCKRPSKRANKRKVSGYYTMLDTSPSVLGDIKPDSDAHTVLAGNERGERAKYPYKRP